MSDDLDLALGIGGFGRPKKRPTPASPLPAKEAAKKSNQASLEPTPSAVDPVAKNAIEVSSKEAKPRAMAPVQAEASSASAALLLTLPMDPPAPSSPTPRTVSDRSLRRREPSSSDSRYGKLISLRVPAHLFEELEHKGEDLGAKSVGQLLVGLLKIALSDPAMLGPLPLEPLYATHTNMTAAERLKATFAQKASAEASRQMTIRLDMNTVGKLTAAAKAAKAKERAPFILAIIERQLRAV